MGYTPARWHHSAQQAAQSIAGRSLTEHEQQEVRRRSDLAMSLGDSLDGARDTLQLLRDCGVRMVLKTKGEKQIQERKIARHRLTDIFGDRIAIVDRKNTDTFKGIAAQHDLKAPVSIGDSPRSDIEPALAAGFDAILILKTDSWSYEEVEQLSAPVTGSFAEAVLMIARRHANTPSTSSPRA